MYMAQSWADMMHKEPHEPLKEKTKQFTNAGLKKPREDIEC